MFPHAQRWPRIALGALLLAGVAACASLPEEPSNTVTRETEWGIATGANPADVARLCDVVDRALPTLSRLPGFEPRPLRVHMVEELGRRWAGLTVFAENGDSYVLIERSTSHLESIVAHELVHYYFRESNRRFPQLVQEGICEELSHRVFENEGARNVRCVSAALSYLRRYTLEVDLSEPSAILGFYYLDVPDIDEALELNAREYLAADDRAIDAFYGLGWMIVANIGYEELHSLAERLGAEGDNSVPPDAILAAAELDPDDYDSIHRGFARLFGLRTATAEVPIRIRLSD